MRVRFPTILRTSSKNSSFSFGVPPSDHKTPNLNLSYPLWKPPDTPSSAALTKISCVETVHRNLHNAVVPHSAIKSLLCFCSLRVSLLNNTCLCYFSISSVYVWTVCLQWCPVAVAISGIPPKARLLSFLRAALPILWFFGKRHTVAFSNLLKCPCAVRALASSSALWLTRAESDASDFNNLFFLWSFQVRDFRPLRERNPHFVLSF